VQLVQLQPLEHAQHHLNPIADLESKAREMLAAGTDETLVAVQCGVTLSKVFEIRRGVQPMQHSNRTQVSQQSEDLPSAKELFARRLRDFDEALEIATQEYKSDPSSEVNHAAMNGFMKTMESLHRSYQELDDPQEIADRIVKQVVHPYMHALTRLNVQACHDLEEDLQGTLVSAFQREQLRDHLKEMMRKLVDTTRDEFNRAVKTLEVVYAGAKLDALYLKPSVGKRDLLEIPAEQERAA
jgi:arginyl-tRNA synthetase